MLTINLVPWREQAKSKKQNRFLKELVLGLLLSVCLCLGYYTYLTQIIQHQEEENSLLKQTLSDFNHPLQEIEQIKHTEKQWTIEKKIINELVQNQSMMIRVLDTLVQALPKGVYLTQLTIKDQDLILTGKAESNALVSQLMKNIEKTKWLKKPILKTITAESDSFGNQPILSTFTLTLQSLQPKPSSHHEF